MHLISANIEQIYALCRKYGVKTLCVFGSILTPRFNEESDVDFAATFYPEADPLVAGKKRFQFYMELEDLMGRKIDLVSEEYLKNPYFKTELEQTKQRIYG